MLIDMNTVGEVGGLYSSTWHQMELSGQLHAPTAVLPGQSAYGTLILGFRMGPRTDLDAVLSVQVSPNNRTVTSKIMRIAGNVACTGTQTHTKMHL
jgi:hypothetical protein